MAIPGYVDYKPREFCNSVRCPVQLELNSRPGEYERIRQTCRSGCKYTAWQFHHWLVEKGYLIVKPKNTDVGVK